jgi:DNA-binding MarR family transcriptional regulator
MPRAQVKSRNRNDPHTNDSRGVALRIDKSLQNKFNMPGRAQFIIADRPQEMLSQNSRAKRSKGVGMMKGQRKVQGGFDLSDAPSHLIRRCQQFYGDLYAREAGARELTKPQFTLLAALDQNEGASQTALVEITGIDRSTLAEMVRRMLERGLLTRERAEEDQRANAVAISPSGRKALRSARNAADRAERALLEALPAPDRQKFIKALREIAQAAEVLAADDQAEPARRRKRAG